MKSSILALIFVLPLLAQEANVELREVLKRASDYVTHYEGDLGNLIGSEEYVQTSAWLSGDRRVSRRERRRLSSDFLIIQVGPEWAALRKVNRVDGFPEKQTEPTFEDAFDNSWEANVRRLSSMKAESTRYNIGDILREINLPTFGLKVLRKSEAPRFVFERAGSAKVEGIPAWAIRFREVKGQALVVGGKGEFLYSKGTLWIEPESGRVLRTEISVENPYTRPPVRGTTTVTYAPGKKVEMLVPILMVEHYESDFNTVESRADYSNFRPFEVDVKFEIADPKQ